MFSAVGLKGTATTPRRSISRSAAQSGSRSHTRNLWSQFSSSHMQRRCLMTEKSITRPSSSRFVCLAMAPRKRRGAELSFAQENVMR